MKPLHANFFLFYESVVKSSHISCMQNPFFLTRIYKQYSTYITKFLKIQREGAFDVKKKQLI